MVSKVFNRAGPSRTGTAARDKWATRLGCPAPVTVPTSDGEHLSYAPCAAGAQVVWRSWGDQGHQFPRGTRGQAARELIWSFFMAHPRP